MTQVDLPQLSLQRYVELVKRRRWQLVPVSVAGLVIGGLVAFFIPRYFVASMLIEHEAVPGEVLDKGDDPFKSIVASARATIPQAVPLTMDRLNWPEAQVTDLYERSQNARDVENRLRIDDADLDRGPSSTLAQLRLTYKDRDGKRAADFLNTLFEIWSNKRVDDLRNTADAARKRAEESARQWRQLRDALRHDQQEIEDRFRIQPSDDVQMKREAFQLREMEREKRQESLRNKRAAIPEAEDQIALDKQQLETLPERVPADPTDLLQMAKDNPQLVKQIMLIEMYKAQIDVFQEGTSGLAAAKRGMARAQKAVLRMLAPPGTDPGDGLIPNPAREALRKQILDAEKALEALKEEVKALEAAVDEENRRLGEAREGYFQWNSKQSDLVEATDNLAKANVEVNEKAIIVSRLMSRLPVHVVNKANVPPRPTDPNVFVIALIGCVLGLGAAIALILLLDVMQGSFKTVDDVERGLTVPVLGGMSHLETEEERKATQRGRRRASLAAFGFVGLVVVVVTIFYVDPTRLPSVVRDLLAMLLGKS